MEKNKKLEMLQTLNESRLRQEVLMPLFRKMEFKDVIEYHGTAEKGKDIIFYKEDDFGRRLYTGVVVKTDNISGSVSAAGGALTILNQVMQTFKSPYTDVYGLKKLVIDRCLVITSGEIKNTAIESITGVLESTNLDKLVSFFDGGKIVDLLDKHMPGYFFKEFEAFTAYFNAMKKEFQTIRDVAAIGQREAVQLEHIYVSLKVSEKPDRGKPTDLSIGVRDQKKIFDAQEMEALERKLDMGLRKARVLDADTAVKNYHRLVVTGAPGAGKTTLLKHIALNACKENLEKQERLTVPIPVTLRDFAQSGKTLREYINHVFEKFSFPQAKESVEKDLEKGKCLLLLDGFDELAQRESQDKTAKAVMAFSAKYPACRVLATSRVAGYHDELTGYTRTELMEFDDQQVKQFIHNWFGEKDNKKAASMLKAVTQSESIKHLARNPLMIAIIAIIYEEDKELPRRRAALYQRAVEVLLSKCDVRKKLKNRFTAEKKEFMLRKLAFDNHCSNVRTMSRQAVLELINRFAPQIGLKEGEAGDFLDEIWQRSYLLREIARDTFDFLHLSFQEYFTALELREQADGIGTIIQHISEPWWEEPILLYAGISGDAAPLIRRIQAEVPEDMFYSVLMLAGKCIADSEFTQPELKIEISDKLWSLYNTGKYKLLRDRAAEVLALVKPRHIIDTLLNQLKDKDPGVRISGTYALGRLSAVEALPALIEALHTGEDRDVRVSTAEALGAIGSAEAVPALVEALRTDQNGGVRESTAQALGLLGSAEAVPALVEALRTDEDVTVLGSATEALGRLGAVEALPALVKALNKNKNSVVRGRAAEALGRLGAVEALPALVKALRIDEDGYVRGSAAEALGDLGGADALSALLKALSTEKDSFVRQSAAYALGVLGSAEAMPALLNALRTDKESLVRIRVASALSTMGNVEALPALLKILSREKDSKVRSIAAVTLGFIGNVDALSALLAALCTDENGDVRGSATQALGQIGDETAVQPLLNALEDEGDYYRLKVKDVAFAALEKIRKRVGKEKFEVQRSKFKV